MIMRDQKTNAKGIVIHNDVWIGCNTTILDGVAIGAHAVIGAGSLVNKNIKSCGVYAGNPAKLLYMRKKK
jgi:acetyltransferase-like isoleucine patch superfamily enzyme